jgi:hypothetical protein
MEYKIEDEFVRRLQKAYKLINEKLGGEMIEIDRKDFQRKREQLRRSYIKRTTGECLARC